MKHKYEHGHRYETSTCNFSEEMMQNVVYDNFKLCIDALYIYFYTSLCFTKTYTYFISFDYETSSEIFEIEDWLFVLR